MTDPAVTTDLQDGVLVITINRPAARNAINAETAAGISAALDRLDGEDEIRVGILTGAGNTFCAGMDLKAFVAGEVPTIGNYGFGGLAERDLRKPLIAAVEGFALAGGFELALACDLIVAADNAQFGIPEVTRGLTAAAGGLLRLPNRIPYHEAMRLALTGDRLSATKAATYGLVTSVVPAGESLTAARALAASIAQNAPLAVAASKHIISQVARATTAEDFSRQAELATSVAESADAHEGALAFVEKRKPVWRSL